MNIFFKLIKIMNIAKVIIQKRHRILRSFYENLYKKFNYKMYFHTAFIISNNSRPINIS